MNSDRTHEEGSPEAAEGPVCPECGHPEIDTVWANCPFPYGVGPEAVELDVRLPVRKCRKCGFEFFDEEAEDLRHEAVCRHLGVLTPREIKALRRKFGFSRADLARLTGLGEATIARWERGELIQNVANDRYLRLLAANPENVETLEGLQPERRPTIATVAWRRLRITEEVRSRRQQFTLFRQIDPVGNN
jgi:putative zinc finger/helix-turn-helix YgiT family protein